ncbi:protein of unknown function, might belong to Nitrilase [Shewanella benthica]|uniref:CN hydrolase domain-containing protein n=1 Tax=Shewanella benthica TaxID=43661 RepID=A0A330LYS7_9GAMM|nr:nitrilase-related carbon-nitrogen hydrolase [Shewanella benthica]SQH74060.1 protein of unknown function, might belong to Nitrilase [Shewanella benthica]
MVCHRQQDIRDHHREERLVIISAEGKRVNRHRKLMPTNPERMVWGFGDGSSLKVVDSSVGRLSTLLCWENYIHLKC